MLFADYYDQWVKLYKEGAVRPVTLQKYVLAASWIRRLAGGTDVSAMTRTVYQMLLNGYAEYHEKQTVTDFHHMVKPCLLDAVDEGLLSKDPTRRVTIKGKQPRDKKPKYLNNYELHKLLEVLDLKPENKYDWLIYLGAKTGLRFSEALGITPEDLDSNAQTLSVNKTFDYKSTQEFVPTKNKSSVRKIPLDWQTVNRLHGYVRPKPAGVSIFVQPGEVIYSTTVNDILARKCREAGVPEITYHGLRHTHASVLLFSGVSVPSVSRRLGHSSIATTQKVYLHIIKEMDSFDNDLIMKALTQLD